ncbi:MAG: CDP-alcohol phosphatidyltransferase family protein [Gemmatimonadetes bacterium]|nr:CDP-alcohol phosphatidyltransferase family protein [Gemmatimonadota bacterium]
MDRVNDILLGPLERPALAWLCRRMPAWVTPDVLTVLGIAGGAVTMAGYALTVVDRNFLWLACAGVVVNWLGDSLDGNLARHRKIERPKYGYFVDHVTDGFVTALICLGIGMSAYVDMVYALAALAAYLLMSILTYVTSQVTGVFRISYGKVGPTEIRLVILVASAVAWAVPNPELAVGRLHIRAFEVVPLAVAVLLALACVGSAWRTSRTLAALEPPPRWRR